MKGAIAIRKPVQTTTLDTSGTNITTGAWATFLTKILNTKACSSLEVFNPSGSPILLATGDAGSEVALPYTILPGGTFGTVAIEIPSGVRISMKALDTNITTGRVVLNQFG